MQIYYRLGERDVDMGDFMRHLYTKNSTAISLDNLPHVSHPEKVFTVKVDLKVHSLLHPSNL